MESLVEAVAGRRLLLVVDNAEHVIDAVADLVGRLVVASASVSTLVTSRQPLGVTGERVWAVPELDVGLEAVELFCDRARAANRSFEPDDAERVAVAELCARLDGMPLAIELAAARVRSMTVSELIDGWRIGSVCCAARVGVRPSSVSRRWRRPSSGPISCWRATSSCCSTGSACSPGASIWPPSKRCVPMTGPDELDVDRSARLVGRPLDGPSRASRVRYAVSVVGDDAPVRAGEARRAGRGRPATSDRHLAHYVTVAEAASEAYEGSANAEGRVRFELEWDNLRSALDHAESTRDDARAERLLEAGYWYSYFGGRDEYGRWVRRHVESCEEPSSGVLGAAAMWCVIIGDLDEGESLGLRGAEAGGSEDPAVGTLLELGLGRSVVHGASRGRLERTRAGVPGSGRQARLRLSCVGRRGVGKPDSGVRARACTRSPRSSTPALRRTGERRHGCFSRHAGGSCRPGAG